MSILANFRILTKILAVILLLSTVAIGITILGVTSLKSISDSTDRIEFIGGQALRAQYLSGNLIAMNRAEMLVASDPRPENRKAAREALESEQKRFQGRIDEMMKIAQRPAVKAKLAEVAGIWTTYQREAQLTFKAAEAVTNFQSNEQLDQLRKEAAASSLMAENLRTVLRGFSDMLENETKNASESATLEYEATSRLMVIGAVVGIGLGLLFGFLIGQYGIAKPIRTVVELLQRLANGNFNIEVAGTERKDEVGDVARTALVFKENGLAKLQLEQDQKDTELRNAAQRKADMNRLADAFQLAVGNIVDTVSSSSTELEAAAGTLTKTADTTQQLSIAVASASEEASANVQSVASATEEMTGSVNEISRQVQESSRIASEAVSQAERTDARINELSQAAGRIGDVVKLITAIAEQTNLLALNATIEAARAGDAGRGFAVVASEVKALAAQTAKATDEISTQIAGMQTATEDSVSAIKEIGGTITRISEIATAIASAVEEQGAATAEISRNVQQAAEGTAMVASNITDVNRGAGETGSASAQVLSSAQSLSNESSRLKLEVDKFLTTVRAA